MRNSKIYPWIVVVLLWMVALLNYLDRQMIATMKSAMMIDIVELESAANFGRLMAVFLWIYGIMSPFAGAIADKLNRKWLIVGSLFIWSGVTFLMGFCTDFNQLYVLRALMGVSEALYIPAGLAMIADYHEGKTRSFAVGIHMTGIYLGQAMGGFGAVIASNMSWELTFHLFGVIGMVYSVILILFLREKKGYTVISSTATRQPFQSFLSMFKGVGILLGQISFWVILLYFSAPSLPGWAVKNWLPTLLANNLHIPMEQAGPLSTITTAGSSFFGVLIGGLLADRWIQRNLRGRIFTGAIGLALTIPALFLLGFSNHFGWILCGAVCFGVGFGMFDTNNMPILCQFVSPRYRATGYGLMNMIGILAGAMITGLLGKSTDAGRLGHDFAILTIGVAIALTSQLIFLRPKVANKTEEG